MQLSSIDSNLRTLALLVVYGTSLFVINNFLTFWWGWPGALATLQSQIDGQNVILLGWVQVLSYVAAPILAWTHVQRCAHDSYHQWADRVSNWAAYSIRVAFWLVLLIGLADALISFLRVESLLPVFVPEQTASDLGKPHFRGNFVHVPLMMIAALIALKTRGLGFTWLTLLVVIAEFMIVITRFIFSYEQAFMGDLVRFWYAALFLFASAHTLLVEGHIRVDVAYTHFSERTKAWVNSVGVVALGLPLCWTILLLGMWDKTSSINSPLLSMEVSQSGYGMYVKYLMVGFLAIFAFSMVIQFTSYLFKHLGVLRGETAATAKSAGHRTTTFESGLEP
ncbi:MAG: TRAP transporter small permease subunit [Gammaproteobacteria bacterium]|nr:TRAP transporter small permease subunit [Gammaproteobacteria bacterium]